MRITLNNCIRYLVWHRHSQVFFGVLEAELSGGRCPTVAEELSWFRRWGAKLTSVSELERRCAHCVWQARGWLGTLLYTGQRGFTSQMPFSEIREVGLFFKSVN